MKKRLVTALIGGALLGIVCVVGAYARSGFTASPVWKEAVKDDQLLLDHPPPIAQSCMAD